jgi:hypothetical protein
MAVGEALSSESEFQAHGLGLIGKVSWDLDRNLSEFFDGKETRPGHIAANLDVRRVVWLEKIDTAMISSKICILRSSSGQGKSALLYRYAYEKWPSEDTFILRACESIEQVELIRCHLRFRANLGLPILLLIDNAGRRTRFWPLIAQECAALGIRVLISIRNEDWHRFALESLTNYEILEPTLDLSEAREIFNIFRTKGKLHESAKSPERCYERIGEPHLLMEYVYLITHGQMLEERLRDQVKQFSAQQEDPAKVEIMRRIALADALGAPVSAEKLLKDIKLSGDPQLILKSLTGEYLKLDHGIITGLHWVRSDHLIHILHEGYPNPESTALAVIEAIVPESIPEFVFNAIGRDYINSMLFIKGLVEKSKNAHIDTILGFIDGIFRAGENLFFVANRKMFDEAYGISGSSGVYILMSAFMPVVKVDFIANMCESLKDERGDNFRKLRDISQRVAKEKRGLDLVRDFLGRIDPAVALNKPQEHLNSLGILLDWCSLCSVSFPILEPIRDKILESTEIFDKSLNEFCSFSQGLYRYDKSAYCDWFSRNREDILGYLKLHTDCIELNVSDKALSIDFFYYTEGHKDANEAALSRLNKLRSAIPFCEHYQSQGIWQLPFDLKPSCDDTHKDMRQENLNFESDIEKNVIWRKIVESYSLPDSYYRYEEAWYAVRKDALLFITGLSKGLKRSLEGKKFDFSEAFEYGRLPRRLDNSLRGLPKPPSQLSKSLKKSIEEGPEKWSSSLLNFVDQFFQYMKDRKDLRIGRLSVINFRDSVDNILALHSTFSQLFEIAPDYFQAKELDIREDNAYSILTDLLDAWILHPPKTSQRDIIRYLRAEREKKKRDILKQLDEAVAPLKKKGITIILPKDVYTSRHLTYLPLAFSVVDPCFFDKELAAVRGAVVKAKEIANFFCLIPINQGNRFLEGGYQIGPIQIANFEKGTPLNWESFIPLKHPDGVMSCLPQLPFQLSQRLKFRSTMILLIGTINVLSEHEKKLEALKSSKNQFQVELYDRHKSRLLKMKRELGIVASDAKKSMKMEFLLQDDQTDFKIVFGFLNLVEDASKIGKFEESSLSSQSHLEEIIKSLNRLLRGSVPKFL